MICDMREGFYCLSYLVAVVSDEWFGTSKGCCLRGTRCVAEELDHPRMKVADLMSIARALKYIEVRKKQLATAQPVLKHVEAEHWLPPVIDVEEVTMEEFKAARAASEIPMEHWSTKNWSR